MEELLRRYFEDNATEVSEAMRAGMDPITTLRLFRDWVRNNAPEYDAAPELLEACRAMRLWVDEPQQVTLEQVMTLVDAAIAKEKGAA